MDYLEELDKSYSGTCIQVEHEGKIYPFYYDTLDRNSGRIHGSMAKNNTWIPFTASVYNSKLLLALPRDGYINHKQPKSDISRAFYLSYRPERQWKKGLIGRLAELTSPSKRNAVPAITDAQVCINSYNPQYTTLRAFLEDSTIESAALSRRLAAVKADGAILLYYCNTFIGYIVESMVVLPRNFSYMHAYVSKFLPCEVE